MPAGTLDPGFGIGGVDTTGIPESYSTDAYSVELQADGGFIVAGTAEPYNTNQDVFALARYHSDGTLDPSFGDAGIRTYDFSCNNNPGYSAVLNPLSAVRMARRNA